MREDEAEFSLSDDHSGPRPSTLVSRRNWPILAFALLFASCILFAHPWFNTDIGRLNGRGQMTIRTGLRRPTSVLWNRPPSSVF